MQTSSHRCQMRRWWPPGMLALFACASAWGQAAAAAHHGVLIPVVGPIGPATSDFFVRQLHAAEDSGATVVVVRIDTPGGLETAMRDMVQAILAANVPIVTYVAPGGARAASAGTYLVYASHVAAMAPATNIGAATPVQIGGMPDDDRQAPPERAPQGTDAPRKSEPPGSAMERKAVNDAVASLRSLAQLRGRNVDWAESAVREGASLPADEAVAAHVVDLIATDLPHLLRAIDGRSIKLPTRTVQLATAGIVLREVHTDWRTDLLQLLTNPNVAYVLFLIGIYGLLLEGFHPGAVLPGVVGAICLLLALFAFQVLPVNYAGVAMILLGVALLVAESFVPSFGTLGLGGIAAFVFGSVMLMNDDVPGFGIAWQLIGAMALIGALLLVGVVSFALRTRRRPVVSGIEGLLRESGEAVADFDRQGLVRVHGEVWTAVSPVPVRAGQRVRIVHVNGLKLEIEPLAD